LLDLVFQVMFLEMKPTPSPRALNWSFLIQMLSQILPAITTAAAIPPITTWPSLPMPTGAAPFAATVGDPKATTEVILELGEETGEGHIELGGSSKGLALDVDDDVESDKVLEGSAVGFEVTLTDFGDDVGFARDVVR
jgi:hypothetical protein